MPTFIKFILIICLRATWKNKPKPDMLCAIKVILYILSAALRKTIFRYLKCSGSCRNPSIQIYLKDRWLYFLILNNNWLYISFLPFYLFFAVFLENSCVTYGALFWCYCINMHKILNSYLCFKIGPGVFFNAHYWQNILCTNTVFTYLAIFKISFLFQKFIVSK